MLEFFLYSFLSEYDSYGNMDCRAGIQTFKISTSLPIQWRYSLESALKHLNYDS